MFDYEISYSAFFGGGTDRITDREIAKAIVHMIRGTYKDRVISSSVKVTISKAWTRYAEGWTCVSELAWDADNWRIARECGQILRSASGAYYMRNAVYAAWADLAY